MTNPVDHDMVMLQLRHLKRKGVVDANVDLFVAIADNDLAAAQAALEAGADVSMTDTRLVNVHRLDLIDFDPSDWG